MFLVSSCSCLCPIHWSQVFNREWRCSWSSADRRFSTTSQWSTSLLPTKVWFILEFWPNFWGCTVHMISKHLDRSITKRVNELLCNNDIYYNESAFLYSYLYNRFTLHQLALLNHQGLLPNTYVCHIHFNAECQSHTVTSMWSWFIYTKTYLKMNWIGSHFGEEFLFVI